MSQPVQHFAINADDLARARAFYEGVFDWSFQAWGPPGFFQIEGGGIRGALQQRRPLREGVKANGFECTISVPDLSETQRAIEANGGRILMQRSTIAGVGHLLFFEDPEGNMVGAMQYDEAAT